MQSSTVTQSPSEGVGLLWHTYPSLENRTGKCGQCGLQTSSSQSRIKTQESSPVDIVAADTVMGLHKSQKL